MKVLILGGTGMLGHKAFQLLRKRFDTYVTFREPAARWEGHPLFKEAGPGYLFGDVHADRLETVARTLEQVRPDVVINCIGIVKQRDEAKVAVPSIRINALFPHQLADLCGSAGTRLFHISTDCVFSGRRGAYTEEDIPDPMDLYGRTKLLGELNRPGCLTLRTSIIGWELRGGLGLLEWFASQRGRKIKGYRCAIYTGLATAVLVDMTARLIEFYPDLSGLYQVASRPISKYDLLLRLRDALGWRDITIEPDDEFRCNRSLVGRRFESVVHWMLPDWGVMISDLAREWATYRNWRS